MSLWISAFWSWLFLCSLRNGSFLSSCPVFFVVVVCLFVFWAYFILGFNVCFYQWSFHSNQSFFPEYTSKSPQLLPITHFRSCFCICRYLIPKSVLAHAAVTNMKLNANNRNLLSQSSGSQEVPDQVAGMAGFWCGALTGLQIATFSLDVPLAFPQCVPVGRGRDGQGASKERESMGVKTLSRVSSYRKTNPIASGSLAYDFI